MKLVFTLAYNGGGYHGFQKQPEVSTVQAELERAIIKLFPELSSGPLITQGAGRTDTGVHADEQVLAVEIKTTTLKKVGKIMLKHLPRVINTVLPDDIRVLTATLTSDSFHPRYQARVRCYRYQLLSVASGIPYSVSSGDFSKYCLIAYPLDLPRLHPYFKSIEGRHNFTSFASWDNVDASKPSRKSAVRIVYKVDLIKKGRVVWIDIYGGSFLKAMVRSLIGNILHHYRKGSPPEVIREILIARDPALAKQRVPAHALTLHRVFFAPIFGESP